MSSRALLLWGGPVYADTPKKVVWPEGWQVDVVPVTGSGSSYFGQLASSYRGADGRILPSLLASKGKRIEDYQKILLAGFSAFHGLANEILKADTDLVDAMISIDSCFSAINSPRKEGYARFAAKAARGKALFVLTIGPGGGVGSGATLGPGGVDFSSAWDCVMESVRDERLKPYNAPAELPAPQGAWKDGGLVVLDYRQFRHDQHINQLAVPLMQAYLPTFLQQGVGWNVGEWALVGFGLVCVGVIAWALWDS